MPKQSRLRGDTNQISIFFLAQAKMGSIYLSSKLSLTYRDNVNHYKSVHRQLCTLPVTVFKTNQ